MTSNNELTYYEYWLTKPFWNASWAIQQIFDCLKFKRGWDKDESYSDIREGFKNKLAAQMNDDDAQHIFGKRTWLDARFDEVTDQWLVGAIDPTESDVKPKDFIQWVYNKGYYLPYEFKAFIGVVEQEEVLNSKELDRIDREVCQGIAKTIWYYEPEMEIEEMVDHKAIQVYGSGKLHSRDTTLRRWLSAVDQREKKTGPKKKT